MDAILGAIAAGDIGKLFPDTSEEFLGISSIVLLQRVATFLSECGYKIVNLDSTLILQRPKVSPYIEDMRKNIAKALGVEVESVSVKATTEEGMGYTGCGEGIKAIAIALVARK
jgi:2-C-methyl-D-erythritol 2,4-cyclodiphosphate synthase